jgi:hypothetical protein
MHEPLYLFHRRTICSMAGCTGKGELEWHFPGARVRFFDQAPPRCPREGCGGPFRVVETGLVCTLCGREVIVGAALRALAMGQPLSRL